MARFFNFGIQETDGFTLQNSPLEITDAVYEAGDPVTLSGGGTDYMTTFVGYEEGTYHAIFRIIDGGGQLIGFDIGSPVGEGTYELKNPVITNEPFGIGWATFSSYGFRTARTDDAFDILRLSTRFRQDIYEVNDELLVELNFERHPSGAGDLMTFLGYEGDTGYPIFRIFDEEYILLNEPPSSGGQTEMYTPDDIVTDMPYTTCFAPGTLIATPGGERAVETLKPGDMVLTADGDTVPVRFVGFQRVPTMFGPREIIRPVRIRAGALGRKVPHTDLVVTRDHGMIVDGVICHAGALINGTSIIEVPTAELARVATYYHVETEGHVPLLANGAVAESFIDEVDRARFANHGEFVAMYGSRVPAMTQMNLPRAMSMRQLPPRIRTRLDKRAAILLAPPAPSGVRRLWQELRDRVRSAGHRLARGPNTA